MGQASQNMGKRVVWAAETWVVHVLMCRNSYQAIIKQLLGSS